MKKAHKLLACLATIVAIAASPADGTAQEELEPGVINVEDVQWSAPGDRLCYPLGVQTAQLGTDPENGGPAYFARFPPGSQFELHWHTHNEYVVVVSGDRAIVLDDERHALSPGSYVVIPGRVPGVPPGTPMRTQRCPRVPPTCFAAE